MQTLSNIELYTQPVGYAVNVLVACLLIWLCLFVINNKLKRKYKKRTSRRARLLCYVALGIAVLVDVLTPGSQYWWLSVVFVGLSLLIYLLFFRRGAALQKAFWLYATVVYLAICFATAFFLVAALSSLTVPLISEIPRSTALLLVTLPLFALLCYLLAHQKQLVTELSVTAILTSALVPTLSCVIFAFLAQGYLFTPDADIWVGGALVSPAQTIGTQDTILVQTIGAAVPFAQTIGAAALFAINCAALLLHDYVLTKSEADFNEQSLLREGELRRIHYEELQSLYEATRTWRHDYANHVQAAKGLLVAENFEGLANYLGELTGSLDKMSFRIKSGSELLDAFLSAKATYAESLGIEFDIEISADVSEVAMTPTELTSLIGNLLDNAIEACQRIEDESIQPKAQIKISRSKDQLVIYAKNTTSGSVELDDEGNLPTSKQGGDHGIGTRQIDSIIKKYRGSVDRTAGKGTFETFATLPLGAATAQAQKSRRLKT